MPIYLMFIRVLLSVAFCVTLKTYLKGAPFYNASACRKFAKRLRPDHRKSVGMRHAELFQARARSRFEGTGQISAGQIRSLPNLFCINHSFAVLWLSNNDSLTLLTRVFEGHPRLVSCCHSYYPWAHNLTLLGSPWNSLGILIVGAFANWASGAAMYRKITRQSR